MNQKVKLFSVLVLLFLCMETYAQKYPLFRSYTNTRVRWFRINNELGPTIGSSFMMSDLGGLSGRSKGFLLDLDFLATRAALGVIYRNNYNPYFGFRLHGNYAILAGADKYGNAEIGDEGYFRKKRQFNLRTHLAEVVFLVDVNLKPFIQGDLNTRWAPFVATGIGTAYYQPQTNINGKWENLRQQHSEGQMVRQNSYARNDALPDAQVGYYPLRKQYRLFTMVAPFNFGVKFNYNKKTMITIEAAYRWTNTDYLDDVSRTYVSPQELLVTVGQGPNNLDNQDQALRYINPGAYITDDEGVPYKPSYLPKEQRGDPSDMDGYGYTALISVTYSLNRNSVIYNCPTKYAF